MAGPIIAEPRSSSMTPDVAKAAVAAGAGAVMMPPLDEERLNQQADPDELTENNVDDTGRRESMRIIRRLNVQSYLETLAGLVEAAGAPIIVPLQCEKRSNWLPLAEQVKEAGAAAIELRPPVETLARSHRSDQIEKSILRITASVAGRIDVPVAVRLPAVSMGIIAVVQALGDTGAAAVTLRPVASTVRLDVDKLRVVASEDDDEADTAAFYAQLSACRTLYPPRKPSRGAARGPQPSARACGSDSGGSDVGIASGGR